MNISNKLIIGIGIVGVIMWLLWNGIFSFETGPDTAVDTLPALVQMEKSTAVANVPLATAQAEKSDVGITFALQSFGIGSVAPFALSIVVLLLVVRILREISNGVVSSGLKNITNPILAWGVAITLIIITFGYSNAVGTFDNLGADLKEWSADDDDADDNASYYNPVQRQIIDVPAKNGGVVAIKHGINYYCVIGLGDKNIVVKERDQHTPRARIELSSNVSYPIQGLVLISNSMTEIRKIKSDC